MIDAGDTAEADFPEIVQTFRQRSAEQELEDPPVPARTAGVEELRDAVGRLAAGAPSLSEAQERELTQIMTRFLPEAPLNWLVGLGADAVAA